LIDVDADVTELSREVDTLIFLVTPDNIEAYPWL
jgi:hypothetical protein